MSAPRDPSEEPQDWTEIRASIRRRLAHYLRGRSAEEIEDATQDVLFKVLLFMKRSGPAKKLHGLITVISRRTAKQRFRERGRRPQPEPLTEDMAPTADEPSRREIVEIEELADWRAFVVIAYLRANFPKCVELAEARARGIDLKRLAEQTGQPHGALLQRWSRCMRKIREAVAKGRLPWDGPEGSA